MPDWPFVTIGEVATVFDGPHATPKTVDAGPIFLGIGSLQDGRINLGETRHVTPDDFKTWTRRVKPHEGDVVFSYETRIGQAAIIPKGLVCCLGRRMGLVRAQRNRLDPRYFLYYYLSPPFQDYLRSHTIHGATVERIALTEFPSFPVPLPPLHTQKTIASILGALDDKIDLNRRVNETLEAMAQALFKDWFVDFGPTRAKMEGREPYLAPDVWALFPERLDEEGKPEGWQDSVVGEICDIVDCLHSKKPNRQDTGETLLQLKNIRDDGLLDLSDQYCISSEDYHLWTSRIEASLGDCVVTNVGRVGAVSQVPKNVRAALGRNMTGVRCKPEFPYPTFLICMLLSDAMKEEIERQTDTGTILNALNVRSIPNLRFVLPEGDLAHVFESLARPLREKMEDGLQESKTLAQIRDLLLPKLMSGEIRVWDAERMVEDVV